MDKLLMLDTSSSAHSQVRHDLTFTHARTRARIQPNLLFVRIEAEILCVHSCHLNTGLTQFGEFTVLM